MEKSIEVVSYLFKCLGTGQKITNAVNPSIDLLFSVSLNCKKYVKICFKIQTAPTAFKTKTQNRNIT